MSREIVQNEPAERIKHLIVADPGTVDAYLNSLSGTDVVRAVFRLDEDERNAVLLGVGAEHRGGVHRRRTG